ncbi:S9 family peptidase [Flavobacterium caseinilyticum]|uniref:S9 family peptidase n=1 Tax=Flavobacterium caseinilyticum TaxID=2541732 RepID=A0A4R5AVS8_9FLAO|nr:prolyl oligopeptidase family serine peptidase [Flavobacterium caseinilyticum]TDD77211.1 S9 family peptidase [Flavobacterium caseinilyticum]
MIKINNTFPLTVLLILAVAICYGQSVNRKITTADYAKWSTLQDEAISPDGLWISYSLQYDYGADTLFVQNCKSDRKLIFPSGNNAIFSSDGRFVTVSDPEKGLILQEFKSGKVQSFRNVSKHEFFAEAKYLAMLKKNVSSNELQILDCNTNKSYIFPDVQEFTISREGKIAVSTFHEVRIIDPAENFSEKTIAQDSAESFKNLCWSENGSAVAFLQQLPKDTLAPDNHRIIYYNLTDSKSYMLDGSTNEALMAQRIIVRLSKPALTFSPDGKRIFFAITTPHKPFTTEQVEIWDTATPLEYTQNKYRGNTNYEPKLAVWSVESGRVMQIGTVENPKAMLTTDKNYAVCFNALRYEPQYEYDAPADLYLKNTHTGKETLILQKQATSIGMMGTSPDGKFINYFRDNNWWIYDIEKTKRRSITAQIGIAFKNKENDNSGSPTPYGSPGWSADGKYFIAYDQYDIWLLSPDGSKTQKITHGSKNKVRYRICTDLYQENKTHNLDNLFAPKFDLTKGLILEVLGDNMASGYYKWYPNGSLKKMLFKESGINRIQKAKDAEMYICIEQTSALPPSIILLNNTGTFSKVIMQSNPQSKKFDWGQAELIYYKNKFGDNLKGILYKPANYKPAKKYPMVVLIYEIFSHGLHNYYNPTEYDSMGFIPSNYFLDDYIVLMPDIRYKIDDPGMSALDCVESSVNAVKATGIVEENHIGIIGHSFGGYEVSFIITQTKTFAAAISGSAISDLIGSYFTYASNILRSNTWRFEGEQYRMTSSPFNDWNSYQRNSPLPNAKYISTPLLSWAGKKDPTIPWTQSASFHMALRRLDKKSIFLVYNGETHTILTPELQKDLTIKTKNWFDYYLKQKTGTDINDIP